MVVYLNFAKISGGSQPYNIIGNTSFSNKLQWVSIGNSNLFALYRELCFTSLVQLFSYDFFIFIIIIHRDTKIDIIADDFNYIAPIMKSWNTSYISSRNLFVCLF